MRVLRLAASLCLAALCAGAPLFESVAAGKVDLEAYLGDVPLQNDTKTFVTEGDEYTDTAISVTPGSKRTVVTYQSTHGLETDQELQVIVHGKKLLVGTRVLGNGADVITLLTLHPKKVVPFQMKPGVAYKFKVPSKVFFNGIKVAKGTEYGTVTFLGFADVTTPLGTFEQCAHFARTDNLRIKQGKHVFEVKDTIESWVAAGMGSVRLIQAEQSFDGGVLIDSIPAQEWLFDHGVLQGTPIGPPEPTGGASASARSGATVGATGAIDLLNADAPSGVTMQVLAPDALAATRASGPVVPVVARDPTR